MVGLSHLSDGDSVIVISQSLSSSDAGSPNVDVSDCRTSAIERRPVKYHVRAAEEDRVESGGSVQEEDGKAEPLERWPRRYCY